MEPDTSPRQGTLWILHSVSGGIFEDKQDRPELSEKEKAKLDA
jgi:hypothetical protein